MENQSIYETYKDYFKMRYKQNRRTLIEYGKQKYYENRKELKKKSLEYTRNLKYNHAFRTQVTANKFKKQQEEIDRKRLIWEQLNRT